MTQLTQQFRAGIAAIAISVGASFLVANDAYAQNASAGADSSSDSSATSHGGQGGDGGNASAGADSSSQLDAIINSNPNLSSNNELINALSSTNETTIQGFLESNPQFTADFDAAFEANPNLQADLNAVLNAGDVNTSVGLDVNTGDTLVQQGGINLDTGGNRILTSVVTYPNTQAVIACDTQNRTITLNTIFGGISWGSSKVAGMEEIQRCSLSRVIKDLLIPEAQSSDPSISARARIHLDALIPGLDNAEASDAYLERFIEALGAGVDPDAASHSSRAPNFVAMLTSNIPFEADSPMVEYLNEPYSEPRVQVNVVRTDRSAAATTSNTIVTEDETTALEAQRCQGADSSLCGDASDAVRRAAEAARAANTPQP